MLLYLYIHCIESIIIIMAAKSFGGYIPHPEKLTLDDIYDVDETGKTSGDGFVFDGTSWGPSTIRTKSFTDVPLADALISSSNETYDAATIIYSGVQIRTPTIFGVSDTTPTAAQMLAVSEYYNPPLQVGSTFEICFDNNSAYDYALLPGAGVTIDGVTIIGSKFFVTYKGIATNIGSGTEAVTLYCVAVSDSTSAPI